MGEKTLRHRTFSWPMEKCEACDAMLGINFDNLRVRVICPKCKHITQVEPRDSDERIDKSAA